MAAAEGFRRLRRLANMFMFFGAALGFAWGVVLIASGKGSLGEVIFLVGVPVIFGLAMRVVLWTLSGFLIPAAEER
jgi:hypothetical protein